MSTWQVKSTGFDRGKWITFPIMATVPGKGLKLYEFLWPQVDQWWTTKGPLTHAVLHRHGTGSCCCSYHPVGFNIMIKTPDRRSWWQMTSWLPSYCQVMASLACMGKRLGHGNQTSNTTRFVNSGELAISKNVEQPSQLRSSGLRQNEV